MGSEIWSVVGSVAALVSTLLAALGLVGVWLGMRQNTRAMELQVLESIFRDIRELDRQYLAKFATWNPAQQNAWSATFFNTVEYLCFVVNQRITRDCVIKKFFFCALPSWRKTFDDHVRNNTIRDSPEMFPEFKKASQDRMTN